MGFRTLTFPGVWILLFPAHVAAWQIEPQPPRIAEASSEGAAAISTFRFPANLACRLFAAEPMVANPVAFHVDESGRVFVCESFRQERGVEDNRNHPEWLDEDLAAQTVADRIAYIRRHHAAHLDHYQNQDDRIRVLTDRNSDGVADESVVFADHFNSIEMGTGAGVLSWKGNVYYTCIPDLWLLHDEDGDGVSDSRRSLHHGYGVRFAFRGHDLHGLIVGPDGRLYFSIGDRGYNLSHEIQDPSSGAVFRCEPDGSRLEVVATGLRNPQELAFDDFGNLFTGDNNSDSGDRARWVFIVPGGDSGWRMHYQYLEDRGPFNRERIWHPWHADTPAYIIPPVANLADGPSGLAWYPGTGFDESFEGRFFLCDFRGTAEHSGVRSFRVQPVGAFWEVVDMEQTFWGTLATDLQFAADGRLYVSDWVFGWVGENKGRIYAWSDERHRNGELARQTHRWLTGGIRQASETELVQLLAHADQRVRQQSQFELVDRGAGDLLVQAALDGNAALLSRVHAIWGIGQRLRRGLLEPATEIQNAVARLLADPDPEVRAQTARLCDECGLESFAGELAGLLGDPSPRVRAMAGLALGRNGTRDQVPAVFRMLDDNADQDPILRHAGIMALAGIAGRDAEFRGSLAWLPQMQEVSPSIRLASCVALRRLVDPGIRNYLRDPDARIVTEAARAIYDVPIEEAFPDLASLISESTFPDELVRRVIAANAWLSTAESALSLGQFAASENAPVDRRIEALQILESWSQPPNRDRVLGEWRPCKHPRNPVDATRAMHRNLEELLAGSPEIVDEAVRVAGTLRLENALPHLVRFVQDPSQSETLRQRAFESLAAIDDRRAVEETASLLLAPEPIPPALRCSVIEFQARHQPIEAVRQIGIELVATGEHALDFGGKQRLIATLGTLGNEPADQLLAHLMDEACRETLAPELTLDVILAAEQRSSSGVVAPVLDAWRLARQRDSDPLSGWKEVLQGGDPGRGRALFTGRTDLSCLRCHTAEGSGGNIGPDLAGIGAKKDRRYLLESIVEPNRTIADGFSQTVVLTDDGLMHTGLVVERNESAMTLLDADGNRKTIPLDTIEEQKAGQSSMPVDLIQKMSKRDLRDLVEYLAQLRDPPPAPSR